MVQTYYPQSEKPGPTMTVRRLIEVLSALPDQDAPIIFKSPLYGVFGGNTAYSIEQVSVQELVEERIQYGPQTRYDDETGEEWVDTEEYEQVFHAWKGVVIE